MKRLFTLSAELATKLQNSPMARQNDLKYFACSYAIKTAAIDDQFVLTALDKLKADGTLSPVYKQELQEKLDTLDDAYFKLTETDTSEDAGIKEFHKARAVSALIEATKENSFDAAADAIYEAAMTSSDQQELVGQLLSRVDQS